MLATSSSDKSLRFWEVATAMERARIAGHEAPVYSVDFSPEGNSLAAASNDAPVYLWNVYTKLDAASGKLSKEDRDNLWQSGCGEGDKAAFFASNACIAPRR
jgi:WD40 repeat protein